MRKVFAVSLMFLLLFLSACSGGGSKTGTGSGSNAGQSAGGNAGGEDSSITILLANEPISLDPIFNEGFAVFNVYVNIGEGLFTTGQDLEIVPVLAESYKNIDDLTWEFKLREGVKFHNGNPFNAEAVKFTYDRTRQDGVRVTYADDINLEEIEIVDDYTVRFHTSEPTPHMLARLANDHFMVDPEYYSANTDEVARNPVGTGPYKLKEWQLGQRITLEANPEYWGEQPSIKEVHYRFVAEEGTQLVELESGNADIIRGVSPDNIVQLESNPNTKVVGISGGRRVFLGIRTKPDNLPTAKKEVRQALNYGTNVEGIIESLLGGMTTRMVTITNPPFGNPDVKKYHYDPELAKQMLADAGYPNGFDVQLDAYLGGAMRDREFLQAIADSLRGIGVNVTLNIMEQAAFSEAIRNRETAELYLRTSGATFDMGVDLQIFQPDFYNNGTLWEPEEFVETLNEIYTTIDPETRNEASFRAQEMIAEEAPMIFLWNQPEIYGLSARVQGFDPQGDERIRVSQLSIQ